MRLQAFGRRSWRLLRHRLPLPLWVARRGQAWLALTGPVGLVIIAITAVVSALVWFFTQTEMGQKLWAKIWPAIKDAAAAVWDWIRDVLWPGILIVWEAIAAGAVWMYENAIKPAWDGIKAAALAVWDWISTTLWPGMVAAWEAIAGAAIWLYENGIKPAWDGIRTAIDVVWGWVRDSLLPGITGVWDAIALGAQTLWGWVRLRGTGSWLRLSRSCLGSRRGFGLSSKWSSR